MGSELLLFILAPTAILVLAVLTFVLPRRLRMERRERELLAQHPDAERTSVYLQFRSAWWRERKKDYDDKIAEMANKGWTFLRASEANPLRTSLTWAGGVNMQFIRLRRLITEFEKGIK